MVEYAIVVALIAVVAMVAVETLGTGINDVFTKLADEITTI
jgi:Flp pilus assembly pilin Flp